MRKSAVEADRDPDDVEVSVLSFAAAGDEHVTTALLEEYRRMRDMGVHRVVLARLFDSTAQVALAAIERLSEELIRAL
jgi:hypothetical protein